MDRGEAALRRADGVGRARIARLGLQGVVAALAVRLPDGMDRREVEDVEAQAPHVVELPDHVPERAVDPLLPLRARQHLVPGGERRRLAVGEQRQRLGVVRQVRAPLRAPHQHHGLRGHQGLDRILRLLQQPPQGGGVGRGLPDGGLDQQPALLVLDGHVLAGGDLLGGVAVPGAVEVAPGLEGVLVVARVRHRHLAAPAIVDDLGHLDLGPALAALRAPAAREADDLVPVREGVGLDRHGPPGDALRREPAAVDLGVHPLHDEPGAGQLGQLGLGAVGPRPVVGARGGLGSRGVRTALLGRLGGVGGLGSRHGMLLRGRRRSGRNPGRLAVGVGSVRAGSVSAGSVSAGGCVRRGDPRAGNRDGRRGGGPGGPRRLGAFRVERRQRRGRAGLRDRGRSRCRRGAIPGRRILRREAPELRRRLRQGGVTSPRGLHGLVEQVRRGRGPRAAAGRAGSGPRRGRRPGGHRGGPLGLVVRGPRRRPAAGGARSLTHGRGGVAGRPRCGRPLGAAVENQGDDVLDLHGACTSRRLLRRDRIGRSGDSAPDR